eukprot:TRINITY_DN27090_c0_g1_i1.p1 TRINITY_DN27090_c0_g1~~TRINITY_DN27090_c0_g1_i1.p1  ORF type:complete len:178 (-),score=2.30 TRINITY_DN27090_c0_g1_i1:340-873(-)
MHRKALKGSSDLKFLSRPIRTFSVEEQVSKERSPTICMPESTLDHSNQPTVPPFSLEQDLPARPEPILPCPEDSFLVDQLRGPDPSVVPDRFPGDDFFDMIGTSIADRHGNSHFQSEQDQPDVDTVSKLLRWQEQPSYHTWTEEPEEEDQFVMDLRDCNSIMLDPEDDVLSRNLRAI